MSKKKILLLSDDLRMHSGVATVSKDIVFSTINHYDWVQLGGAIKHPDEGKIIDLKDVLKQEKGVEGTPYCKIYATSGYGNPDTLREVIAMESPDAILHYTDPRFWQWLYQMEREFRTNIPLFYYNIWDDIPDPYYNELFYRTSDLLMAISKQTYGINKRILSDYEDWQVTYVPHGISSQRFFKLNPNSDALINFKAKYNIDKYEYKILYSNRNIRRKMPGDVVLAYKHFMDSLPESERQKCVMVFHTQPVDDNGTDLPAVCKALIPDYPVVFTHHVGSGPMDDNEMNLLFNSIDVYINLASNEGFGLGSCEALSVEKPIIINVTGGLQDQCGFKKEDGTYLTSEDYIELKTNHKGVYKEHGEWVKPVWPTSTSLQGSPITPYIFDDRCAFEDAGDALKGWYDAGSDERARCGRLGYEFVKTEKIGMDVEHMGNNFIQSMDTAFEKWTPRERFTLEAV
jgi:glycosyltransferase involved in cell wall biosynthesis